MKMLFLNFQKSCLFLLVIGFITLSPRHSTLIADDRHTAQMHQSQMMEDEDGVMNENEYRRISVNGAVTRRACPYTCEMRGISRSHCREWKSKLDESECYVEDTSQPSQAMPANQEPR